MTKIDVPRLFHIGTQKAGSTFVYNMLKEHPNISLSEKTEINFYSTFFDKGVEWYSNSFKEEGEKIDISPKYFMMGDIVASRIASETENKNPLFLLILRNPIDYLNSHFQMHVMHGHFKRNQDEYPVVPQSVSDCVLRYPNYINRALYAWILEKYWLKYFSLDKFKIVIFEDFVKDPENTMKEILQFWNISILGLGAPDVSRNTMLRTPFLYKIRGFVARRPWIKERLKNSNIFMNFHDEYMTSQSSERISTQDRSDLAKLIKNDVRNLEEILGYSILQWKDFS